MQQPGSNATLGKLSLVDESNKPLLSAALSSLLEKSKFESFRPHLPW
jgi:hypothetical protein